MDDTLCDGSMVDMSDMMNEELVERLALVFDAAADDHAKSQASPHFHETPAGIRAVLAELAKMGAEALPSASILLEQLGADAKWEPEAAHVIAAIGKHIIPVLAAKDAELARQAEEIERLRARERVEQATSYQDFSSIELGRTLIRILDGRPVEINEDGTPSGPYAWWLDRQLRKLGWYPEMKRGLLLVGTDEGVVDVRFVRGIIELRPRASAFDEVSNEQT